MMYWVRDSKGGLVNLSRADSINVVPPDTAGNRDHSLCAWFNKWCVIITVGSKAACLAELEILHAKLTAAQANVHIVE